MAFTRQELQAGFRIGECLIEPRQNRIVRGASEVHVEPQVWGDVIVTDQAVTNCISELRQHLGDDRSAHRVIETIPKRGYRLAAPVQLAQSESPEIPSSGRRWRVAAGLMLFGAGKVSAPARKPGRRLVPTLTIARRTARSSVGPR